MLNKEVLNNAVLALLIYLPTCAFIPLWLYLVLIAYCLYLNFDFLKEYITQLLKFKVIDKPFTALIGFAIVAMVLRLVDSSNWESSKDFYSYAYLFPFTYLVARTIHFRQDIFTYIIYFTIVESLFGIVEYLFGTSTFFVSLDSYFEFESYELLYDTRVFGLSANSSGLSSKYLMGLILISISSFKTSKKIILEIIILSSSVLTFGRIALVAIVFLYFLKFINSFFIKKNIKIEDFVSILLFVLFFAVNPSWTKSQFSRNGRVTINEKEKNEFNLKANELNKAGNKIRYYNYTNVIGMDKLEMSGRHGIWNSYMNFIADNPIFGNMAKKHMLGSVHAHNSYLQLLSSFGIFLFFGIIILFSRYIIWDNYLYVLAIMVLSLGQYVIFWGISIYDIIFYYLIFFYKNKYEK